MALENQHHKGIQKGELMWHTMPTHEVTQHLKVIPNMGLSTDESNTRRLQSGSNSLAKPSTQPAWKMFLNQFKSILILILITGAFLAGIIGNIKDSLVILIVVLANAILGFYQEYRAEQSLAALKKMLTNKADIRRDGRTHLLSAKELVPGDIVILNAGDRIPADGRVLQAHGFKVDESSLTGESHAVEKQAKQLEKENVPLAERNNMLYMNTTVSLGRAEMVVTSTGMATEVGRLANMLAKTEEPTTPLQIQLDSLGKWLAIIACVIISILLIVGLLRGEPWVEMIMTGIALAVAAIPEGLPAVVTVTLAMGLHRMARHKAIVKRLASVETLGCSSVICSDKTGTLTINQMTARALFTYGQNFTVGNQGDDIVSSIVPCDVISPTHLEQVLIPLTLCNDANFKSGQITGDPMDGALLMLAAKSGLNRHTLENYYPRIAEIPFDASHKYMATFHRNGDNVNLYVKGAPDVLIKHCAFTLDIHGHSHLNSTTTAALYTANANMAKQGMRVLAVAEKTIAAADFNPQDNLFGHINQLRFDVLVGLTDPPRSEVRNALALCHRAGIQVKMITGDQQETATAIAHELGITGEALSSEKLDTMDDATLATRINNFGVFTRTTPEQKVRIVQALKANGHVVAMTGDGVNDAPVLKTADIGVAMGITGTDVAKEAATMVLTNDNFSTIVDAVAEGRSIYDNIIKFIHFQLSTNIGAMLTVLLAPFFGLPLPLNPIQILWVNIIMDGPPAMALDVDPAHKNVMDRPPRNINERILTLQRLGKLTTYGATMAAGTLGILFWGLQTGTTEHALTLSFTTFILFQMFNVFNARADQGTT